MLTLYRPWRTGLIVAALSTGVAGGWGQVAEPQAPAQSPAAQTANLGPAATDAGQPANAQGSGGNSAENAAPAATAKKSFTVPAGTKVLLQLRSSVNTKSAKPGDGVYLASTFPVVVGDRVLIPAGVYVQGVVDSVERAGHVKGRAHLDMHFTSMIFPNGSVVEIPGLVNSLPGATKQKVKSDGEGTIEEEGDKTRNMGKVAAVSIPTGTTVGAIGGVEGGHAAAGTLGGLGAGLATAGIVALFTRGADVDMEAGSQVEMVLQRPLILEEENVAAGSGATALVPTAEQPKPMEKPNKARVMCPPGGLGCE